MVISDFQRIIVSFFPFLFFAIDVIHGEGLPAYLNEAFESEQCQTIIKQNKTAKSSRKLNRQVETRAVSGQEVQSLHPKFKFTDLNDLKRTLINTPPLNEDNAKHFLTLASEILKLPSDYLLFITKERGLPKVFEPKNLTTLDSSLITTHYDMKLVPNAASALLKMSEAAQEENIGIKILSAYRSYSYQEALFEKYSRTEGEEEADLFSARAGHSQHQMGTTVDLVSFDNQEFRLTRAGQWIQTNAKHFGWSLSYPQDSIDITGYTWESWHWRWLGVEATEMQETFFEDLQHNLLEFWNLNSDELYMALIN